jgi:hypothetical protein
MTFIRCRSRGSASIDHVFGASRPPCQLLGIDFAIASPREAFDKNAGRRTVGAAGRQIRTA